MFKYDADLSSTEDGVWTEFDGAKFKIAHMSNMKFQRALARQQQPHRRKLESGTLDPKLNRDIVARAMSEGILLDWKNVKNSDGQDVDYTSDRGFIALQKNVEFREYVSEFAMNLQNFKQDEVQDMGNG